MQSMPNYTLESSQDILDSHPALFDVIETFPVRLSLTAMQKSDAGLLWMTAIAEFVDETRGLSTPNKFIIQVCPMNAPCANEPYWSSEPMSKESRFLMMRKWFQECTSCHSACEPENRKLPRRLISVGSPMKQCVRLISTEGKDPTQIRYATLSYCWGQFRFPHRTMKANLASNSENISIDDLPMTFQDALAIVRSLALEYLWIDSLCIVQDDVLDWRSEVANMSDIFFGSTLTIAACDAEDSTGGFFARPTATALKDVPVQDSVSFMTEGSRDEPDSLIQVESQGNTRTGISSVLHRRGWTLQEVVLSHRVVQFTHSQLQWRCKSAYWTETGITYDVSSKVHGSLPLLSDLQLEDPVLAWWTWIESYSARSLTVQSDTMPAICGLVKYYQRVTGDVSAIGLWQRSLPQDLLWMRVDKLIGTQPAFRDSVPTWSWLSCPVRLAFDFFGRYWSNTESRDHIRVHEFELAWTCEPFLSDIKTSRLIISGPVKETFLALAPEAKHFNPPYFVADNEVPESTESVTRFSCAVQFDREQERSPGNYLCMLGRRRVAKFTGDLNETFLILEPVLNATRNEEYRRIGLGMFRGRRERFSENVRKTVSLV